MPVKIYKDEPIQWHLSTSGHDKCPRCRGELGYIKQTSRMCLSDFEDCGTWNLPMTTAEFEKMKERGDRIRYPLQDPPTHEMPDTSLGNVSALKRAAKLVEGVRATLNAAKADPCESCGLKRAENWDESQLHTQLGGVYDKLNKIAKKLERLKEEEEA